MKITLTENGKSIIKELTIIKPIEASNNLLLSGKEEDDTIFFVPILFLAVCNIQDVSEHIIGAFYIEDTDPISVCFLNDLPTGYSHHESDNFYLIDYNKYSEIIKQMNKSPLSLIEYVKSINIGDVRLCSDR